MHDLEFHMQREVNAGLKHAHLLVKRISLAGLHNHEHNCVRGCGASLKLSHSSTEGIGNMGCCIIGWQAFQVACRLSRTSQYITVHTRNQRGQAAKG